MSKALPLFAVNPGGSLADNAPQMLYTRLSEMLFFAEHIHDVDNVAELHSMRIAAKRLRYTMEIFAPAYERESERYASLLEQVKYCQEQIGAIHDCDVRLVQVKDYLNQNIVKKPEIRSGLVNLMERETDIRQSLYDQFVAHWSGVAEDRSFEKDFVSLIFSARLPSARPASANGRVRAAGHAEGKS